MAWVITHHVQFGLLRFHRNYHPCHDGRIKALSLWSGLMLPTAFTAVSYWLLPFAAPISTLYQAGSFSLNISSNSFRGLPYVCLTAFVRATIFQFLPTQSRVGSPHIFYLYPGVSPVSTMSMTAFSFHLWEVVESNHSVPTLSATDQRPHSVSSIIPLTHSHKSHLPFSMPQ